MSYEKVKQAKHISIGLKQTLKAIELGKAQEVVVAKDADKKVTSKVIQYGMDRNVLITYVDSMKNLGKASGIDVNAATVAILKD